MDFRKMNDKQLAAFAVNIAALLGGTELSAIDSHVRATLVAAIGTLPATLDTQADQAAVVEEQRMAAVADRNDTKFQLYDVLAQIKMELKAGRAPKGQYTLCGFEYPAQPVGTYIAQDPTELSGVGFSNGVNKLKFKGNNRRGQITYEIWRRQGDEGPWGILGTAKKQQYTDKPVIPGQYYEYKVRAVAAKSVSNYSNSAVVYGVL